MLGLEPGKLVSSHSEKPGEVIGSWSVEVKHVGGLRTGSTCTSNLMSSVLSRSLYAGTKQKQVYILVHLRGTIDRSTAKGGVEKQGVAC